MDTIRSKFFIDGLTNYRIIKNGIGTNILPVRYEYPMLDNSFRYLREPGKQTSLFILAENNQAYMQVKQGEDESLDAITSEDYEQILREVFPSKQEQREALEALAAALLKYQAVCEDIKTSRDELPGMVTELFDLTAKLVYPYEFIGEINWLDFWLDDYYPSSDEVAPKLNNLYYSVQEIIEGFDA